MPTHVKAVINGETIPGEDILDVSHPNEKLPYWYIALKDGRVIAATGDVCVVWAGEVNDNEEINDA